VAAVIGQWLAAHADLVAPWHDDDIDLPAARRLQDGL